MSAEKARCSVLIVEDNDDLREAITYVLRERGHTTLEARDGTEAVALLNGGSDPDVIVLDIMMPKMDGIAFRKWQQGVPGLAHIPVIVFSAAARRDLEGIYAWLRKGDTLDELVRNVDEACSRAGIVH